MRNQSITTAIDWGFWNPARNTEPVIKFPASRLNLDESGSAEWVSGSGECRLILQKAKPSWSLAARVAFIPKPMARSSSVVEWTVPLGGGMFS